MAGIPDSLTSTVRPRMSSPVRQGMRRGTSKANLRCPHYSFGNGSTWVFSPFAGSILFTSAAIPGGTLKATRKLEYAALI
jgi:hypothetical protein